MRKSIWFNYWPVLCYWILCGAIGTLIVTYSYEHGSQYVKLYSHFFMYPLFFGWIGVALVVKAFPFVKALLFKWNRTKHFWVGIAIFSGAALLLELDSVNIAPWEISPKILESDPLLSSHFSEVKHTYDEKLAFQNLINDLKADAENWSLYRWIYPSAFFVHIYSLLTILFVSGLLAAYRLSSIFVDSRDFRIALISASAAIAVSLLYSLMRIAYSAQKLNYYPAEGIPAADYVILGLFIVALILATACFWVWLGEHIAGVFTFVFGGTGLVAGWRYKEALRNVFGADASYLSYICILLAILLLGYMWWIFRPPMHGSIK